MVTSGVHQLAQAREAMPLGATGSLEEALGQVNVVHHSGWEAGEIWNAPLALPTQLD